MTSPFHPGTHKQFAWDSTSLGWFKQCPRKYWYSMIEGWQTKRFDQSVHLRWGSLYHSALEKYDRLRCENNSHEEALHAVVRYVLTETWDDGEPWEPDHNLKTRPNLIRSVVWYLEQFRNDPATTLILANGKPAVELSFKLSIDNDLVLCGHLDRVVNYMGDSYVMDRKSTASTLAPYYFNKFKPDNQMTLYSYAGQVILASPVKGVIIDAVQVAVGFSRFSRGITYRTESEMDEWLLETKAWVQQAHIHADADFWPANDTSCDHFGGCVFRKVCSSAPQVRDIILNSDFERRPWNPLIPR